MNTISIHNLSKSYADVSALSGVSLEISGGELFGLIGPDGAGKTTLFRLLTTLLVPDTGTATVCGFDTVSAYRQIRRCIGYMPGRFSLYPDLSVRENLALFATVFGVTIEQNYELIRDIYVQIEPFADRHAGALSGGMKQKLALCCALIHKPEVLLLDEPTTGVDPVSRQEFWQMLLRLRSAGITIMVSTPYMDEASLCDRIAFMLDGRILAVDTPAGIVDKADGPIWSISGSRMPDMIADLRRHPAVASCYAFGAAHHVTLKDHSLTEAALADYLTGYGYLDVEIVSKQATIEDCFMDLVSFS